jgi:ubiquitin-like 1-activating enzyme E1 A
VLNILFSAIWEYQGRHGGALPDDATTASELESIADELMKKASVNPDALKVFPRDLAQCVSVFCLSLSAAEKFLERSISTTAAHEFSPVCAVVGGLVAQDILKSLGRKELPMNNFFVFDGVTGSGTVLSMKDS